MYKLNSINLLIIISRQSVKTLSIKKLNSLKNEKN